MSKTIKIEKNFIQNILDDLDVKVYGIINDLNLMGYYDKVFAYHRVSPIEFCDYKEVERLRLDSILAGAKSAIVIGIPYNLISEVSANKDYSDLYGTISNSAWEFDYHRVLKSILEQALVRIKEYVSDRKIIDKDYEAIEDLGAIEEEFHIDGEIAVDTSPLVDRILAKEAGIGQYGKNTCIINEKYGSAFYIGSLILNIDIDLIEVDKNPVDEETDIMNESICKTCEKCVELCPGNALKGDYTMDVNRCISYITQKKEITFQEMKQIGTRVYGCDVCQLVCPYNIRVSGKNTSDDRFIRTTSNQVHLMRLLSMSNKELQKTFKESGFIWRGPKIIKRNCMIGLGNHKSMVGFEYIVSNIDKFSDELVMTALWSLFAIDKHKTIEYLEGNGKKIKEKYFDHIKSLKSFFSV